MCDDIVNYHENSICHLQLPVPVFWQGGLCGCFRVEKEVLNFLTNERGFFLGGGVLPAIIRFKSAV